MEVNNIRAAAGGKYGVTHKKEYKETPLKLFMKCNYCRTGFTSYAVKRKYTTGNTALFHYYKCPTIGCNCNKSALKANEQFMNYLSAYSIRPNLVPPLLHAMNRAFDKHNDTAYEQQQNLNVKLSEMDKKIEELEEDHYIEKKIPAETYSRLMTKLVNEKKEIQGFLANSNTDSSNLKKCYTLAVAISSKPALVWTSSDTAVKEKIQKLIFPDGIYY